MPRRLPSKPTGLGQICPTEDIRSATSLGGVVVPFTAAAALNVGDAVFVSAADTVNKSTVAGDRDSRIGVVVSGDAVSFERRPVGIQAAAANGVVMVCVSGRCEAVSDAAVSVGDRLMFGGTTAGRLTPAADITATQSGSTVDTGAVTVTSTAANGAIITDGAITVAGDGFGRIVGVALSAAAGAGTTIRVLVSLS